MVRITLSTLLGERRMTQAGLARATGIRPATIGEYYNELCERVNLEYIELICDTLNCSISDL
ncbi:MAG: helix-turn-helix transcriptional regulator, partial [Oscillospiraceae bacterium]|nr:helix-turn-helix transcriptional regulator [Oscillospiraceae bacterium]